MAVQRLTATDAEVLQRRAAGTLWSRGLRAGDRVVLVVAPSANLIAVVLGALRVGVVPVLLNPSLLAHERSALVDDAEPAVLVDDARDLETLLDGPPIDLAPAPLARPMHYTSGTTGRPKGVWSGVLEESGADALLREEADLWGFCEGDVHLVCAPMHHSAPVRFAAGTLMAGGEVIILPRFDPGAVVEAIEVHRPTTTFMAPAHLHRLFSFFDQVGSVPDLSSFRLLAHAGSPCPEPLKRRAMSVFPTGSVWEFYGSTEGQFTACSPEDWLSHPGSVGRARPGRVMTVDADGTLWCETPSHARFSYWADSERTASAWRADAFSVGDLGRIDDEGFVHLDGRRDDLIITGGVNVYPVEVEQALAVFPGVSEVVVFGMPDDRWGQRVCGAVVGHVDLQSLAAYARTRLAAYKCPKQLMSVPAIPHTENGKVRRSTLAADLGMDPLEACSPDPALTELPASRSGKGAQGVG